MRDEPGGDEPRRGPTSPPWWASVRRHPVVSGVMLGCILAGTVSGPLYLPEEWSLIRQLAAGAVAGAGTGLLVTATKMLG